MTDEQIIKALESCPSDSVTHDCSICPYKENVFCFELLGKDALKIINRQKAEIERLQGILLAFMDEVARWESKEGIDVSRLPLIPICDEGRNSIDRIRAKAINQFAERLKEELEIEDNDEWFEITEHGLVCEIDNLVKEMVGDKNYDG